MTQDNENQEKEQRFNKERGLGVWETKHEVWLGSGGDDAYILESELRLRYMALEGQQKKYNIDPTNKHHEVNTHMEVLLRVGKQLGFETEKWSSAKK